MRHIVYGYLSASIYFNDKLIENTILAELALYEALARIDL